MSAASCRLTEDQFLCSICLDVFTDPVTIPCGHNFCKTCITQHWNINVPCQCPNCKEVFNTRPELKVNTFISEMANLEGRMCTKHDKLLELFCKTDQMCVCMLCTVLDHKTHDVVPLKEEYEGKKAERLKIEEMKRSVELSKKDADREIAEISELEKRSSEVKKIPSSKEDLFIDFQSSPSLNTAPSTKDWTGVSVRPPSYEGTVVRAVNQLEKTLSKQMKKLFEAELKRVQQYAVDVTLDPDTAHPKLILSDDGKQVKHGDVWKNLPDNPERFDPCPCVLAKLSVSSGRFYYEVQVKEKTKWDLGVARESINRKGNITLTPQNGYWTICLRNNNEYYARAVPSVSLSLKSRPEKVGVFVDYEEGLVSFYDVDAAALIYSFTGCCFTQKLYSYFSPCFNDGGKNSAPLIIYPVNHTE
uniref:Uncharacterized protein n=1 Tax=Sparus aurata TaxID=8175 RepID=A0A671VDQ3_SPAAU